jgi:hypothetical protein
VPWLHPLGCLGHCCWALGCPLLLLLLLQWGCVDWRDQQWARLLRQPAAARCNKSQMADKQNKHVHICRPFPAFGVLVATSTAAFELYTPSSTFTHVAQLTQNCFWALLSRRPTQQDGLHPAYEQPMGQHSRVPLPVWCPPCIPHIHHIYTKPAPSPAAAGPAAGPPRLPVHCWVWDAVCHKQCYRGPHPLHTPVPKCGTHPPQTHSHLLLQGLLQGRLCLLCTAVGGLQLRLVAPLGLGQC